MGCIPTLPGYTLTLILSLQGEGVKRKGTPSLLILSPEGRDE
jgi:hypothetical protein